MSDDNVPPAREERPAPNVELSSVERALYDRIPNDRDCHPDELSCGEASISEICATLTMLEIYGLIETTPGGRICRKV